MSKIRINELARQLEVKSREVIDKLHELGITEALTHSSSIDDDNAEKLRRYFGGDTSVIERAKAAKSAEPPAPAETPAPIKTKAAGEAKPLEPPKRGVPIAASVRPPVAATPADSEAKSAAPAAPGAPQADQKKTEAPAEDKPRAIPLRPPMLGRGAPIHPPVGPRAGAGSPTPSTAPHPPAVPLTPPPPLRPLSPPTRPIPSGGTRPGQILSGPRQPLPSAPPVNQPRPLSPAPASPATPSTPPPAVRPGVPIAPPPRPTAAPGQPRPPAPPRPAAGQPIAGQQLAGQPAVRPVVPP